MKISEITVDEVKKYLRIDDDTETNFDALISGAKAYIVGKTGIAIADLDSYEDLSIAMLVLISDMYDNRSYTVANGSVNRVVDSILYMHRNNFIF